MKATAEKILDEISPDLCTYMMSGNLTSFTREIDSNLNIDNIEKLLRIHFVLTENRGSNIGVIDFVKQLPLRLRRIKTTVRQQTELNYGVIKGKINYKETMKQRHMRNPQDRTLFVCDSFEKNYDIAENLILKCLLSIIYQIVNDDLCIAFNNQYSWLKDWIREQALKEVLSNLYLKNIYLRKISFNDCISDRMLSRIANSRIALYREAALLLTEYRKLMNYQIDADTARELLSNTFIKPERTEVLFELYWAIKIIQQFNNQLGGIKFKLIEPGSDIVAQWSIEGYDYILYHNSTGGFTFSENIEGLEDILTDKDNYFGREIKAIAKLNQLTSAASGIWAGRPDIILKKLDKDGNLKSVLIGEVKYTTDKRYATQGLKELLEYISLIKINNHYIEDYSSLFERTDMVRGCIFMDKVDDFNISDAAIQAVMFGQNTLINVT